MTGDMPPASKKETMQEKPSAPRPVTSTNPYSKAAKKNLQTTMNKQILLPGKTAPTYVHSDMVGSMSPPNLPMANSRQVTAMSPDGTQNSVFNFHQKSKSIGEYDGRSLVKSKSKKSSLLKKDRDGMKSHMSP